MVAFILTLASLASAAAVSRPSALTCRNNEFTLAMRVGSIWQSINALGNGSSGVLSVVAEPKQQYPGTPVIREGNSSATQLLFDLTGADQPLTTASGLWGLFVGDIGDVEGAYLPVIAEQNVDYDGFSIDDRQVFNRMTDADQSWLACNVTIDGAPYVTLGWGLQFQNGSWPAGCEPSAVKQRFNLD